MVDLLALAGRSRHDASLALVDLLLLAWCKRDRPIWTAHTRLAKLARMALLHTSSGQVVNLGVLDVQATETCALLKASDIEIMWLALPAGKQVPSHAVSTSMTLQCMRGRVQVQLDGDVKLLKPGEVIYLAGGVPHGLHALEDARLLMTIVLPASRSD